MNRKNNSQNTSSPANSKRNGRRNQSQNRLRRRNVLNRRTRRFGQILNRRRNRLARAQYASRNKQYNRKRRFAFRPISRINLSLRKLFIGGLHKSITNRKLYNLFRQEGRILSWKVFYDRNGYSRGFGVLEFDRPRDAWRTIKKWNNTPYMGYNLRIEYKNNLRRRMNRNRNRRMFNAYNKGNFRNNVNNRGFNWSKNNNYQNGVRNVNIINRNRNRFYYN